MAGQPPSDEELAAAAIVAQALGGRAESRDGVGAASGMHDFDIELPDDRCVALEVTSAINETAVRLSDAAHGTPSRARHWPAPGLASDWLVVIGPEPIGVARLMEAMVPILRVFEHHGEHAVDTSANPAYRPPAPGTAPEVVEASASMFKRRVKAARSLGPPSAGDAQLFVTISGGVWADIDRVDHLVAERAADKQEKLMRATAAERHLFVWFDGTQPEAELAIATGPPPSSPPAIASEIDVVWLATPPLDQPQTLWRVRPPNAWEVLR